MGSWHTGTVRAADVFAPLIMNQRKCRSCSFWWRNWSETYITTLNLPISVSFQAISGCGDLQYSGRPRKTADHSRSSQINNESPESFIFRAQNAYTSLKGDASYCKRVSWMSDKPAVAVYEYQGQLPVVKQPHGSARCTESEFVRSKPQVLAAVRMGLQGKHAKLRDVYEAWVTVNDWQLAMRPQASAQSGTDNSNWWLSGLNVVADISNVLGSVQNSSFVKHVALRMVISLLLSKNLLSVHPGLTQILLSVQDW